jgi:exonuclease III
MDNRVWNILCWNIRGLNGTGKCDAIRDKIEEFGCSIVCLQETKREDFDISFIRKFAPRRFDSFDFAPSNGASGGLLLIWCSSTFQGQIIEKRVFCITARFTSLHNGDNWFLSNVYGPCVEPERSNFIHWFKSCEVTDRVDWIFLGDFNFYRSLGNRNKPGGNLANTLVFNEAIGHLGLIELPLKGRAFTWSNMQNDPLLE